MGAGSQAAGVRQIANPQSLGTQLLHMLNRGHIARDLKAHKAAGGSHVQQGCDALQLLERLPEAAAERSDAVPALLG